MLLSWIMPINPDFALVSTWMHGAGLCFAIPVLGWASVMLVLLLHLSKKLQAAMQGLDTTGVRAIVRSLSRTALIFCQKRHHETERRENHA